MSSRNGGQMNIPLQPVVSLLNGQFYCQELSVPDILVLLAEVSFVQK